MKTFWHSNSTGLAGSPGRIRSGATVIAESDQVAPPAIALTREAAAAIKQLVAEHHGAGLRILPQPAGGESLQLHLEMSEGPAATDEVVEDRGSRVFIDEKVVRLLAGKTLDVEATRERGLRFRLVS